MAQIEDVVQGTGKTLNKLSKNKLFWIIGGGVVVLTLLFKSRGQGQTESVVMETYPEAPPQTPAGEGTGNQLDAYTSVLDSQLNQGLQSIYGEMENMMNQNSTFMQQELMKQQQAYAGEFAEMQSALSEAMNQNQSKYQQDLLSIQAGYESQLQQLATQRQQQPIYTPPTTIRYDEYYAGSILGGESLRPDAINYGDYVVNKNSQVQFKENGNVVEHDPTGGVITYKPNGNISYDFSNMNIAPASQSLIDSVKKAATKPSAPAPKPAANPNKMNIGGHDYSVDAKGNVYKNNKYVPAENFKYIPSEVLSQAKKVKQG